MPIFYDEETAGIERNSQILEVAFIDVDDNFRDRDSLVLKCRPGPVTVEGAGAMLITGFMPGVLAAAPLTHYQMMTQVVDWLQRHSGDRYGYNNLNYDDHLMTSNCRQNLLDPGLIRAQRGRGDVFEAVKAALVYMPGVLKTDILNERGHPSLKLGDVAKQNGITLVRAHGAENDAAATKDLAHLLSRAAPQVWNQMTSLTTVQGVDAFLAANDVFTRGNYTQGRAQGGVYTSLAPEAGYADAQVLFSLDADPAPYKTMSVDELAGVMKRKSNNPFKILRKDRHPILMPMDLSAPVIPQGFDDALAAARVRMLRDDPAFLDRVAQASAQSRLAGAKFEPIAEIPEDTQQRLSAWAAEFHAAPAWTEKAGLAETFNARFANDIKANERLAGQGRYAQRIVYEHAPGALSPARLADMKRHIAARILNDDPAAAYLTLPKARAELEKIREERAAGKPVWTAVTDTQLDAIAQHYAAIERSCTPNLPPPARKP